MNYFIKLLFNILLVIGIGNHVLASQPISGMPEFTEEDIAEFEKQIQEELSKLPPEEQEKILKEAEELAEKMKTEIDKIGGEEALRNMSEEDAIKFFEKIFSEESKPAEPVKPEPVKEEKKPVEPEKKLSTKQQKALDLINNLIRVCNSFIIKSASVPEFPEKIKSWVKKKKIKYWDNDTKWDTIKNNLELLVQKLEKVKEQDPKNKTYKFLDDFIANETLYNNLSKLLSDFNTYEPTIDPTVFGLKKLEKDSKTAIQKFTTSFGEAIQQLKVLEGLDGIFEKYEPKAKKIKEEEEAARKKAESEGKKSVTPGRQVIGGKAETPPLIGGRTYQPSYPGESPSTWSPYPSIYPSGEPSDISRPSDEQKSIPGRKSTGTTPTTPKESKDESKKIDKKSAPEDRRITRALDQIESSFDAAISYIYGDQTRELFANLEKHISDESQDVNEDLVLQAPRIANKLTGPGDSALTGINRLEQQLKSATKERKSKYKKDIESAITKEQEKALKKLVDDIETLEKKYASFTGKKAKEKIHRYFGDSNDAVSIEKSPLGRMAKAIRDLFEAIRKF